jgi:site-specific DNA recombinase
MPVSAIIDKSLFAAAQEQLRENRTRARVGLRRPGYLLRGLTCCALCGYAFYGKTTRQRGRGHRTRDFQYYRCSGTDTYRFGGERICSNTQVRADKIEAELWNYVCEIIKHPGTLEEALCHHDSAPRTVLSEDVDSLKAQRQRLQHGMERLIDTLAEGVIDTDQFTSRMERAKTRLADLDAKIASQAADEDRRIYIHLAMRRLTELSSRLQSEQSELKKATWATKREIIRAVVQRIEIGPTKIEIVFRLPTETDARGVEPIVVKLSRA